MRVIIMCLVFVSSMLAQIDDATAQANGWIKVVPKQFNIEAESVRFIDIDDASSIRDVEQTVIFGVRFYDESGKLLGERAVYQTTTNLWNISSWTVYITQKKALVLSKFGLTEIPY